MPASAARRRAIGGSSPVEKRRREACPERSGAGGSAGIPPERSYKRSRSNAITDCRISSKLVLGS